MSRGAKMQVKPGKPDVESFISKADTTIKAPKRDKIQGDKTYLLRLPYELWYELKMEALKKGSTLHDYILHTLNTRKG